MEATMDEVAAIESGMEAAEVVIEEALDDTGSGYTDDHETENMDGDHDEDGHGKPDYDKPDNQPYPGFDKPHHEMNDHHGPHHDKDDYDRPDHGMHDKPMNHTDDDWWYPEDEYHYASSSRTSTSTIALSIPAFILTMFNK